METRVIAALPTKGVLHRRPANQCVYVVPSGRGWKDDAGTHRPQELSPASLARATLLASITPDSIPQAEKDIIERHKRLTAYKKQSIRLGCPEHVALLKTLHDTSSDHTPVNDILDIPQSPWYESPVQRHRTYFTKPSNQSNHLALRPPDWRVKAKQIIEKKKWDLDKEMSRSTWKQKVSNDQRLLLLEDDGYDISELLMKGTTADDIITAVLERVDARKKARVVAGGSAFYGSRILDEGDLKFHEIDRSGVETVAPDEQRVLADMDMGDEDDWDGETLVGEDAVEDVPARPIFVTTPVIGQKRKHTDFDDDDQVSEEEHGGFDGGVARSNEESGAFDSHTTGPAEACFCGPSYKRMRTKDSETARKEEQKQIRSIRRRYALRDVFAECRLAANSARVSTDAVYAPSFSHVVFTPPASVSQPSASTTLRISLRGLHFITDELSYLSTEQHSDGTLILKAPEGERSPIEVVFASPGNKITLIGETLALEGLFNRLKNYKFLHIPQCGRVELFTWEMVGEVGSFSKETESELTLIIERLGAGHNGSGVFLEVRQYDNEGMKLRWV